jgi:hypothetical protein
MQFFHAENHAPQAAWNTPYLRLQARWTRSNVGDKLSIVRRANLAEIAPGE